MVDMDRAPCRPILIDNLKLVGNPSDLEGSLPSRSQFAGALRRGRHREDETTLLVWVNNSGRRRSSHLLVSQLQPLIENLYIGGGIIDGWEAQASCCTSGGRVGSRPVAIIEAENPCSS